MMRRIMRVALAVVVLVGATVALGACRSGEGTEPPDWLPLSQETPAEESAEAESGPPMPEGSHGHGDEVLMMGRSVMGGWFAHWGYDGQGPVLRDGYALYYREVAGPTEIGEDAASIVAGLPENTIVFFKLCFVDFWAMDAADVDTNAEECLGYVRQVKGACDEAGLTLVVGNALPQVSGATSVPLVETHRQYNAALDQLAAEDPDMAVFDMYGILAGSDGTLPKGLAVSPDDSHLNEVAYRLLDEEFFVLLDRLPE